MPLLLLGTDSFITLPSTTLFAPPRKLIRPPTLVNSLLRMVTPPAFTEISSPPGLPRLLRPLTLIILGLDHRIGHFRPPKTITARVYRNKNPIDGYLSNNCGISCFSTENLLCNKINDL